MGVIPGECDSLQANMLEFSFSLSCFLSFEKKKHAEYLKLGCIRIKFRVKIRKTKKIIFWWPGFVPSETQISEVLSLLTSLRNIQEKGKRNWFWGGSGGFRERYEVFEIMLSQGSVLTLPLHVCVTLVFTSLKLSVLFCWVGVRISVLQRHCTFEMRQWTQNT